MGTEPHCSRHDFLAAGRDTHHRHIRSQSTPLAFDEKLSPFAAQASAFAAAVRGEPHDFSIGRNIALMRLFDRAYREAIGCL